MGHEPNQDSVFSLDEALARIDHDHETLQIMIELFMEHGRKDLADTQAALDAGNAVGVARSSHRLKGAILQFCAPAALQVCKELEETAKTGDLQNGKQLYAVLEREVQRLLAALLHQVRDKGKAA